LRGFAPDAVLAAEEPPGLWEVSILLSRGDEHLHLMVRPRDGFSRPYLRLARVSLGYRKETPLDGPEKTAVAHLLARALDRHPPDTPPPGAKGAIDGIA
jgi:hypothetical protein